jgi:hypothetical protein
MPPVRAEPSSEPSFPYKQIRGVDPLDRQFYGGAAFPAAYDLGVALRLRSCAAELFLRQGRNFLKVFCKRDHPARGLLPIKVFVGSVITVFGE